MGVYIAQSDVEGQFGVNNIAVWSQLDNTTTSADTSRISDAIDNAEQTVEDRFRGGPYAIPFTGGGSRGLVKVIEWCSKLAGVWLYESRGLRDAGEDGDNKLTKIKADVLHDIAVYLSGQTRLKADAATADSPTGPVVI